jgi:hypothetical protein
MTESTTEASAAAESFSSLASHSKEKVLITDKRGRVIAVRKLNALQIYRLTKAMGASASNAEAMNLAIIASSVSRIDTFDFAFPAKERDIEFLIEKLDFDGIAAAGEGLASFVVDDGGTEAAKN